MEKNENKKVAKKVAKKAKKVAKKAKKVANILKINRTGIWIQNLLKMDLIGIEVF